MTDAKRFAQVFRGAAEGARAAAIANCVGSSSPHIQIFEPYTPPPPLSSSAVMAHVFDGIAEVFEKITEADDQQEAARLARLFPELQGPFPPPLHLSTGEWTRLEHGAGWHVTVRNGNGFITGRPWCSTPADHDAVAAYLQALEKGEPLTTAPTVSPHLPNTGFGPEAGLSPPNPTIPLNAIAEEP